MFDVNDYIKSDEKVIEVVRRHWINILPLMAGWVALAIVGLFGFYTIGRYQDSLTDIGPMFYTSLGLVALMLLAGLLSYATYWVYSHNCLIVTDKNLYKVVQISLFSREVSQFSLERLQDVVAMQNGFLPITLGYGDIVVETAGEKREFVFTQCHDPKSTAATIMQCHRDAVARGDGATPSP